ncbi:hypothetical protein GOV13_02085 [Candidatus Pacearchaeota archaeon]|nr:hypothetical protein [Candidatus Pacearchaeota archaeon]
MERVLYNKDRIKIQELERSPEDHELMIDGGEGVYLILQRDILREFAESTPAHKLLDKIRNFDSTFSHALSKTGLSEYDIHLAICRAYTNKEKAYLGEVITELEKKVGI